MYEQRFESVVHIGSRGRLVPLEHFPLVEVGIYHGSATSQKLLLEFA